MKPKLPEAEPKISEIEPGVYAVEVQKHQLRSDDHDGRRVIAALAYCWWSGQAEDYFGSAVKFANSPAGDYWDRCERAAECRRNAMEWREWGEDK